MSELLASLGKEWKIEQTKAVDFGIASQVTFQATKGNERIHHTIYETPSEAKAIELLIPISRGLIASDQLKRIESASYPVFDRVLWFQRLSEFGFFLQKGCQLHYVLVRGPDAEKTMVRLASL